MMDMLSNAMETARKFYGNDDYYHAMRVAAYVSENGMVPCDSIGICAVLAVIHDLPKNSQFDYHRDFCGSICKPYIYECLKILAWDKKDTYEDYIKNIKKNRGIYPEAYWVKIADIKDHLIQKETLEDGAMEKYIAALLQLL